MIIVDTGILVAVANRADRWHQQATGLLRSRRHEMIVPAPVIVESAWLIASELGNTAEAAFIAAIGRGELHLEDLQPVDYQRAAEVLATDHDNNLGLVDTCVMAIAERVGATVIATINPRDFRIVRPAHCDAYELLPTTT